jgi:hypothetical protein
MKSTKFAAIPKAMWVWGEDLPLQGDLRAFTVTQTVKDIFLYVSPTVAEALLRRWDPGLDFLRNLRSGGHRVYAVAGEPSWVEAQSKSPPNHVVLLLRLCSEGIVDGLHLDVEPHSLPEWREPGRRKALIDGTIALFESVQDAAGATPIDAAVNPIYATVPDTRTSLLSSLMPRVDSISIMAYRRPPGRAIQWAEPSILLAEQANRAWRMGVLADPDPDEPGIDWAGGQPSDFCEEMVAMDSTLRQRFSSGHFKGLIFQSYDGLRKLVDRT